jgi:hypothetical protein
VTTIGIDYSIDLTSADYTWLMMDRENARKLTGRLISKGRWFAHKCQEGEHTIVVQASLDLQNKVFKDIIFQTETSA